MTLSSLLRPGLRSALVPAALIAVLADPVHASIVSGTWTGDFSIPAFDGPVGACAIQNGQYFVAGDFRWAGNVAVRNVARWTGEAWAPVAGGLPMPVNRLALQGTSLLAATSSNPGESSPVMRYDGVSWQALGAQLYGEANALLVDGPEVYVAGALLQPGLTNDNRVLRWDGSAWQPIGGGFDGRIFALALYQDELYAAGEFLFAEDHFVSRIARWDGAHWQSVGGGTNAGGGVTVRALAVYGGRLVAGGYLTALGGVPVRGIGAWNGTVWDSLPGTPKDAWVTDLLVEGDLLQVAGVLQVPNQWASGLVTFDGQSWNPPVAYPSWGIQDLALEGAAMIAVGYPSDVSTRTPSYSSTPVRDVVVRDPTWRPLFGWKPTMRGLLGPSWSEVMTLHTHRGELYAGGYFEYAAAAPFLTYTGSLVRWTGSEWASVGNLRGWVHALTSWGDQLVVGGSGFYADNATYTSVVAWNGASWGDLGGRLEGMAQAITEWQGAVVAAGGVRVPGQGGWSAVAIHRTSGWEILGAPLLANQTSVFDVATFRGELFVAGYALQIPGGSYGLLRWNGADWVPLPNAPEGSVRSLLTREDGLWVGFASPRFFGPAIWRWDGAHWTQMGDLSGDVTELAEAGGEVVAAGLLFTSFEQVPLARWTGTEWLPIRQGPENGVETMAALGTDLYVGGSFRRTALQQSEALARWSFVLEPFTPAVQSISTSPNPARDRVTFRFALTREGRASVVLYDLHGARIATALDEVLPAGFSERSWTIPTGRMPAGVYLARIQVGGARWGQKVVVVR